MIYWKNNAHGERLDEAINSFWRTIKQNKKSWRIWITASDLLWLSFTNINIFPIIWQSKDSTRHRIQRESEKEFHSFWAYVLIDFH